jgi:hypothetical protein
VYVTPITAIVTDLGLDSEAETKLEEMLLTFRKAIQADLDAFSVAIRTQNVEEMNRIRADIERIRQALVDTLPVSKERTDIIAKIDEHLKRIVEEQEVFITRNERFIKERIGDTILRDTDGDGISDYDEVNMYETNPFSADTDADGYIDGTEILGGYDPLSSEPETLVVYESPQETGSIRDDILTVSNITTLTEETSEVVPDGIELSAIISGKGLPNSFVTLYIFSTPIVITIKTDADGNWSYLFDKELDEGSHEIYVGLTDNAGRLIAKSNPLPFVKTAEAYTKVNAAGEPIASNESTEPALIGEHMMLSLASMAVVGLGLVLILLGLHAYRREEFIQTTS